MGLDKLLEYAIANGPGFVLAGLIAWAFITGRVVSRVVLEDVMRQRDEAIARTDELIGLGREGIEAGRKGVELARQAPRRGLQR